MGFETLFGNQRLKENLNASLEKGRISHFYLISGPEGSGKHTLAKLLSAAILCRGTKKPCLGCSACRKVMDNTHPDFITVDDPEKKTVPVELIRQARSDIYIRPNEAEYKIYLFPRAQDMGIPGQNALLKVLEEPPKYGVFLLLTDNPEKLLPTVRSRCTELALQALPGELLQKTLSAEFPEKKPETLTAAIHRSGGFLGQARTLLTQEDDLLPQTQEFLNSFLRRDPLLLVQTLAPMEKWKREQLLEALQQWVVVLEESLVCRAGMGAVNPMAQQLSTARSSQELMYALNALQKAREYALGNISPGAICGWLTWELR